MKEINYCMFCEGDAEIKVEPYQQLENGIMAFVECQHCSARGSHFGGGDDEESELIGNAIDSWNAADPEAHV